MSKQDVSARFTTYLRKSSKLTCTIGDCGTEIEGNQLKNHIQSAHKNELAEKDLNTLADEVRHNAEKPARNPPSTQPTDRPSSSGLQSDVPSNVVDPGQEEPRGRGKSSLATAQTRAHSSSPPKRSRVAPSADPEFNRSPQVGKGKKLWTPDNPTSSATQTQRPQKAPSQAPQAIPSREVESSRGEEPGYLRQPETRPIGQDQLVTEVKGIYAGLVMVESKCIEVDTTQSSQNDTQLTNEQWQALIALHRTLLHEHHDFFLASQHPSASPALRRLAAKYAMPARMWRHGIHSFLELLRHRLPASLEQMLTFIYLAYSMMALLYETVPAFEDTWIECLGDLGRYRMAIEDEDIRDREVWTSVSRGWYSKASDKAPTTGRLYHHLAILARPNALQQLFYYTKSLCVPIPFASARDSIMTLFDPIMKSESQQSRLNPVDAAFVKAHGILFTNRQVERYPATIDTLFDTLDNYINSAGKRWMEPGYYMAIANCCALLSYGKEDNVVLKSLQQRTDEGSAAKEEGPAGAAAQSTTANQLEGPLKLFKGMGRIVLARKSDPSVLPYLHVLAVFLLHLARFPDAMKHVEKDVPWATIAELLTELLKNAPNKWRHEMDEFPRQEEQVATRPLPEDFAMKGLVWVGNYFPGDWFSNEKIDDEEKHLEVASMTDERKERILWIFFRVMQKGDWLEYDEGSRRVTAREEAAGSQDTDMVDAETPSDP